MKRGRIRVFKQEKGFVPMFAFQFYYCEREKDRLLLLIFPAGLCIKYDKVHYIQGWLMLGWLAWQNDACDSAVYLVPQSYPRKMFAADFQPSWPSRPQTKGTLLFYFLKLYNFGFYEVFVGSTSSELQHPWISKIRCKPKKSRKKSFFRISYEVLVINRSFWNFSWSLQFAWILNCEFIHNFVCLLHRHEKWAYFYSMQAKNGHFSVFSSSY